MADLKQQRLKALISELEAIKGRHTELITVYVPAGFNLNKVSEQIRNEQSTAQNIKSKSVRKNVMSALEKILQHLKLYKKTPENGLAIFCGNVSGKDGVSDLEIWAVEPPEPAKVRMYRCDQAFVLDPLKEIVREREVYGLIVIDKSDAEIGLLKGKKVSSLKHLDSLVPGKTAKGGWSQARYARVREGILHDFMKKVGEIASEKFRELRDLKGVIVGGPGAVKDEFMKGEFLVHDIQGKVLGTLDTSYTGEPGLHELLNRAEELLAEASITREKKILERFFGELKKDTGLAVYGFYETMEALSKGAIEMLLLSEAFDWIQVKLICSNCKFIADKTIRRDQLEEQKCPDCDGKMELKEEKDMTEEILKLSEQMSTNTEVISIDTPEGEQLKELGGIAGIMRYKLE